MRNPNGYGTIKKLSGNRKKPYGVYITTGYEISPLSKDIGFLEGILSEELYEQVKDEYDSYLSTLPLHGRQIQKCIGYYAKKQDAMIALAEYNRNPFDVDSMKVTFEDVYKILYNKEFSSTGKSNRAQYRQAFDKSKRLHKMKMCDIRLNHLQAVVDEYSHMSVSTQSTLIKLFHAVFKYCVKNDIIEKDYSIYVRTSSTVEKTEKKPFTREEILIIWKEYEQDKDSVILASTLVLLYTGLRISELLNLKKEDFHLSERYIEIHGTKTRAAERIVPIHRKIIPIIEELLSRDEAEYFISHNSKSFPYHRFAIQEFKPLMDRLEIKHTIHECRHTFISIAAARGLNPVLLKKIVGHASKDVTESVYTHTYIEDLIKEIDKYEI